MHICPQEIAALLMVFPIVRVVIIKARPALFGLAIYWVVLTA